MSIFYIYLYKTVLSWIPFGFLLVTIGNWSPCVSLMSPNCSTKIQVGAGNHYCSYSNKISGWHYRRRTCCDNTLVYIEYLFLMYFCIGLNICITFVNDSIFIISRLLLHCTIQPRLPTWYFTAASSNAQDLAKYTRKKLIWLQSGTKSITWRPITFD